jgi:hypothetical protein
MKITTEKTAWFGSVYSIANPGFNRWSNEYLDERESLETWCEQAFGSQGNPQIPIPAR